MGLVNLYISDTKRKSSDAIIYSVKGEDSRLVRYVKDDSVMAIYSDESIYNYKNIDESHAICITECQSLSINQIEEVNILKSVSKNIINLFVFKGVEKGKLIPLMKVADTVNYVKCSNIIHPKKEDY